MPIGASTLLCSPDPPGPLPEKREEDRHAVVEDRDVSRRRDANSPSRICSPKLCRPLRCRRRLEFSPRQPMNKKT